MWKPREFFDQKNYIEKSTRKPRGFFYQRNYIEKYAEMTWKFVEIWSSTYRHNIHVESTSIRRGVPVGILLGVSHILIFVRMRHKDVRG